MGTSLIKKASLLADDLKNYRPLSGLSFTSKLVDCVVSKQLLEYIYAHEYKTGHLMETALLFIKNEVHLSLSRGKPMTLPLLIFSAVFVTIDHSTLLSCL